MDFGGLRIEGRKIQFVQEGKERLILCRDVVWAYQKASEKEAGRSEVTLNTRLKEKYLFQMSKAQAQAFLEALKNQNPRLAVGCSQDGGQLPLNSLENLRDLGTMRTMEGKYILPGRLLRSGDLYHISYGDQNYLWKIYNLKKVIDFRTDREREERPDTVIHGAEYTALPILDEKTVFWEENMLGFFAHFQGDAEAYMLQFYEKLALDRRAQKVYGDFFQLLKHHREGAILWHCGAGKDRAGVATALLLYILGVSRQDILEDYMRSEEFLRGDSQAVLRLLDNRGLPRRALKNAETMLAARELYIQHAFDKIMEKYKTMDKYMKRAIGLTAFDMNFLKDRYLL